MPRGLRQFLIFAPPVLLAGLNLTHPIIPSPVYAGVLHHLAWWLQLHVINLALFPLFGLAAYLLMANVHNAAATVSRFAVAVFIPVYAAFDALMGIGTGTLVQISRTLPPDQGASATPLINAFYDSAMLYDIAAAGSIAWVIAMLAAAVAFTAPERRRLVGAVAVISFMAGGWARSNLFLAADGVTITRGWWMVTLGIGIVMFAVGRPRVTGGLLPLAGALFGASHVTPTGPLGAACFLVAAWYHEFVTRKKQPV
jgi:hypothetical protein